MKIEKEEKEKVFVVNPRRPDGLHSNEPQLRHYFTTLMSKAMGLESPLVDFVLKLCSLSIFNITYNPLPLSRLSGTIIANRRK